MRELVLLLLILATIQTHAIGKNKDATKGKLKLTPPGQTAQATEDPGSATRLLYEDPRNKNSLASDADKKGVLATTKGNCTDNMGMIYKQGDPGYEACLRTFGKTAPNLPGDNKRPNSVGITIGR